MHAPVEPGVGHQQGDQEAPARGGPAQHRVPDPAREQGERDVEGGRRADVTTGEARRGWRVVQVVDLRAAAAHHDCGRDEHHGLHRDRDGRHDGEPPLPGAPPQHGHGDDARGDDEEGRADVGPRRGQRIERRRAAGLEPLVDDDLARQGVQGSHDEQADAHDDGPERDGGREGAPGQVGDGPPERRGRRVLAVAVDEGHGQLPAVGSSRGTGGFQPRYPR